MDIPDLLVVFVALAGLGWGLSVALMESAETRYALGMAEIARAPLKNGLEMMTPAAPDRALRAIVRFLQQHRYRIDYFDPQAGLLLVSCEKPRVLYYHVRISAQAEGGTQVAVECRGKWFLAVVERDRWTRPFLAELQAAIYADS